MAFSASRPRTYFRYRLCRITTKSNSHSFFIQSLFTLKIGPYSPLKTHQGKRFRSLNTWIVNIIFFIPCWVFAIMHVWRIVDMIWLYTKVGSALDYCSVFFIHRRKWIRFCFTGLSMSRSMRLTGSMVKEVGPIFLARYIHRSTVLCKFWSKKPIISFVCI